MANAAEEMFGVLQGYWKSRCVWTFSHMGLADELYGNPQTAEALAAKVNAYAPYLYRLLRLGADFGLVVEDPVTKRFSLGALGDLLRKDSPMCMKWSIESELGHIHYEAWAKLEQVIRTGKSGVSFAFGEEGWEVLGKHPEAFTAFNNSMSNLSNVFLPQILTFDFSPFKTIVDVGGGTGSLLRQVLNDHPSSKGIVFDEPKVIAEGKFASDRLKYAGGNFFESVPSGGDLYVLKHIMHDWNDEDCAKILRNIRKEIPSHGKLLIVDSLLPYNPMSKWTDMIMMTMLYGKERTEEEWKQLFHSGGFKLEKINKQPSICLFEGVPV